MDENGDPRPYILSALLKGHTDDVRCLATNNASSIFSTSRDSTCRSWEKRAAQEWEQTGQWTGHQGYVNSVCWMPGSESSSKGYLLTSGADGLILLFDLSGDTAQEPLQTLFGHSGNVCALHSNGSSIVSGSWDFTARVWTVEDKEWSCSRVLPHNAAVWDVLSLELKSFEDAAVTACADGLIRLFRSTQPNEATLIFKGHEGPVRALAKVLPEDEECLLFASASNDGTVRIWNLMGDAITVLTPGHDSFVYALVSIPSAQGGGLASSGEDGIVKIWGEEEGDEVQQILVPALSVWSLTTLDNGDLAIGCSDNLIWVFTREESRKADAALTEDYETRLSARAKKPASANSLPVVNESELSQPGAKEGAVKLVEKDGVTFAYQWNGQIWENLGEVTSGEANAESPSPQIQSTTKQKTLYNGEYYDFVFDIDISDDAPPLKLPYNYDDDPATVAKDFVAQHKLPESYVERITEWVDRF